MDLLLADLLGDLRLIGLSVLVQAQPLHGKTRFSTTGSSSWSTTSCSASELSGPAWRLWVSGALAGLVADLLGALLGAFGQVLAMLLPALLGGLGGA